MLERLADMLRKEDSRGGFEASADMLSITGMTLEQFAALMQGLGYNAEKGERDKPQPATPESATDEKPEAEPAEATAEATDEITSAPAVDAAAEPADDAVSDPAPADSALPETAAQAEAGQEEDRIEVFYTFTWGGNRNRQRPPKAGGRPQGKGGKPRGKGRPRGKGDQGNKPRKFEARPPRKEKAIDPDNPFAQALMGLKSKDE